MRRLMVIPLLLVLITSLVLLNEHPLFRLATYGQLSFYLAAVAGACLEAVGRRMPKVAAIPLYFCLVNAAALVAAVRVLTGRSTVLWVPQRTAGA
jgi:hypothetical protein